MKQQTRGAIAMVVALATLAGCAAPLRVPPPGSPTARETVPDRVGYQRFRAELAGRAAVTICLTRSVGDLPTLG